MNLNEMIDDVLRALIDREELHGARVHMVISNVGPDGRDVDIKFIVPHVKKSEPDKTDAPNVATKEEVEAMHASMPEMLREAAELLLGQIDMTQESMVTDQPVGEQLAVINRSICDLAGSAAELSREYRYWESETIRRKLETMREAENTNKESVRRWEEAHG